MQEGVCRFISSFGGWRVGTPNETVMLFQTLASAPRSASRRDATGLAALLLREGIQKNCYPSKPCSGRFLCARGTGGDAQELAISAEDERMMTINDLVEDWIQIRSTLQRQLKMLQSGDPPSESVISESERKATFARIKGCIDEMNALLKEYARDHQL
jgi:hypothetical protein